MKTMIRCQNIFLICNSYIVLNVISFISALIGNKKLYLINSLLPPKKSMKKCPRVRIYVPVGHSILKWGLSRMVW